MDGNPGTRDRLKDFYIKFKSIFLNLPWYLKYIILITVSITFLFFRYMMIRDRIATSEMLSGLLRNEYLSANSYALSKSVSDLELLKIISCAKLVEQSELKRVYYDTTNNTKCVQSNLGGLLFRNKSNLLAINGLNYELTFQQPFPFTLIIIEFLSYILIVIVFFMYIKNWVQEKANHEFKIRALEIEKTLILDMAKQVRHDVASPITALKSIVQVLNNVNPEIKLILKRAVDRTEEIFNQLNDSTKDKLPVRFGVLNVIQEIIAEKKIIWGDKCNLIFTTKLTSNIKSKGVEVEFKRILSNLLNNSFESLYGRIEKKICIKVESSNDIIQIMIQDTGKGMPKEVLDRLGAKGFSHGKESHQTAGSGLGVHHAMASMASWGGSITFESQLGVGTECIIKLPLG